MTGDQSFSRMDEYGSHQDPPAWPAFPNCSLPLLGEPQSLPQPLLFHLLRRIAQQLGLKIESWATSLQICSQFKSKNSSVFSLRDCLGNLSWFLSKWEESSTSGSQIVDDVVVQLPSCVWLFAWTAACQASLSFTISQSLLRLMSTKLVMAIQPSQPLSSPFPPAFNLSQHQGLF